MRCFTPPFKGNEAAHQCPRADSRFLVEGFPSLILNWPPRNEPFRVEQQDPRLQRWGSVRHVRVVVCTGVDGKVPEVDSAFRMR